MERLCTVSVHTRVVPCTVGFWVVCGTWREVMITLGVSSKTYFHVFSFTLYACLLSGSCVFWYCFLLQALLPEIWFLGARKGHPAVFWILHALEERIKLLYTKVPQTIVPQLSETVERKPPAGALSLKRRSACYQRARLSFAVVFFFRGAVSGNEPHKTSADSGLLTF